MKVIKYIFLGVLMISFSSCDNWLDVNDDPNNLTDVPSGELLLKGTLLASSQIHKGHMMRSSMYYTGGLVGYQLVQETIYTYKLYTR